MRVLSTGWSWLSVVGPGRWTNEPSSRSAAAISRTTQVREPAAPCIGRGVGELTTRPGSYDDDRGEDAGHHQREQHRSRSVLRPPSEEPEHDGGDVERTVARVR